jgi:hypothetical protein
MLCDKYQGTGYLYVQGRKWEAADYSETSVTIQHTAWSHFTEDESLHSHCSQHKMAYTVLPLKLEICDQVLKTLSTSGRNAD